MNRKYKIEFTPRFRRRFKALNRDVQVRILRKVKLSQDDPYLGNRYVENGGESTQLEIDINIASFMYSNGRAYNLGFSF